MNSQIALALELAILLVAVVAAPFYIFLLMGGFDDRAAKKRRKVLGDSTHGRATELRGRMPRVDTHFDTEG